MSNQILNSQRGMSLPEVMVAAAISVVIAMGVMKINETGQKGMRSIEDKSEIMTVTNTMRGHLLNGNKCLASSFAGPAGHTWNSGTVGDGLVPIGSDSTGYTLFSTAGNNFDLSTGGGATATFTVTTAAAPVLNSVPWSSKWFLSSYRFYNRDSEGLCHIMLNVTKRSAASFGGDSKILWFPIKCELDGANKIDSCSSDNAVTEGFFQDNPSPSGGIISSAFPVMIGTDPDPTPVTAGLFVNAGGPWTAVDATKTQGISLPDDFVMTFGTGDDSGIGYDGANMLMRSSTGIDVTADNGNISMTATGNDMDLTADNDMILAGTGTVQVLSDGLIELKSSAGNIVVSADDKLTLSATNNEVNISSSNLNVDDAGNVTATGSITAGTEVNAENNITSNTGDLVSTVGSVDAFLNVVASTGHMRAGAIPGIHPSSPGMSAGDITASNDITAGGSVTGNYLISANLIHTPTIWSNNYFYYSDKNFKKRIEGIKNASEKLEDIVGVTYFMKRDEFPDMKFREGRQIGLIAQNVEEYFPELVVTDPRTGMKGVQYGNFVAILIEAFKEQKQEIKNNREMFEMMKYGLERKNAEQDLRIEQLENENEILREEVRGLSRRLLILEKRMNK